jgi:hypothetical protein
LKLLKGDVISLVLADPLTAVTFSFVFLAVLVYKRISLEITLLSTSLLLALLSLDFAEIPSVFTRTAMDSVTISLVGATLGIMLLSQLYKETGKVEDVSRSLGEVVKNSKVIVSVLPAVIGLLPVAGGALMSAPLIETEADNLRMDEERKVYVNVWFRHIIFPVYPVSQVLILLSALTGVSLFSVILRQIPVVLAMSVIGYFLGLWKVQTKTEANKRLESKLSENLAILIESFLPILMMIFVVIVFSWSVFVASLIGLALLMVIARPSFDVLCKTFNNPSIYTITLAAFGAMLLRNVTLTSGISEVLGGIISNGQISEVVLLSGLPAILAFLVGSPSGGIAITVPILEAVLNFTPKTASLLYSAAYLGYVGAPTHLCLVLTAKYFKTSLNSVYKYMVPSLIVSCAVALLIYFMV